MHEGGGGPGAHEEGVVEEKGMGVEKGTVEREKQMQYEKQVLRSEKQVQYDKKVWYENEAAAVAQVEVRLVGEARRLRGVLLEQCM